MCHPVVSSLKDSENIIFQKSKTSRFASIFVAAFSLLVVIALAADSAWLRRLLLRILTSTADDVENHRKYDSVDYTPELNEWIQGNEENES